jgi:hypothetical protein
VADYLNLANRSSDDRKLANRSSYDRKLANRSSDDRKLANRSSDDRNLANRSSDDRKLANRSSHHLKLATHAPEFVDGPMDGWPIDGPMGVYQVLGGPEGFFVAPLSPSALNTVATREVPFGP